MIEKRDWLDFGLIAFWVSAWLSLVYFVPVVSG